MIECVVHAVNSNDVDTELLEISDIARTSSGVGQGVNEGGGLKKGVVGVISGLSWERRELSATTRSLQG